MQTSQMTLLQENEHRPPGEEREVSPELCRSSEGMGRGGQIETVIWTHTGRGMRQRKGRAGGQGRREAGGYRKAAGREPEERTGPVCRTARRESTEPGSIPSKNKQTKKELEHGKA